MPPRRQLPGPHVRGQCASCRLPSLYLAEGGIVTCGNLTCGDPLATAYAIGYRPQ